MFFIPSKSIMKKKKGLSKLLNFRRRKIVHYSLIACILLIQITIAGFFYNEFINRKQLTFIERQLREINTLENLTADSRKELLNAQKDLQKYLLSKDDQYLKSYFNSLNKLSENLDNIDHFKKNPKLNDLLNSSQRDSSDLKRLKILLDSTYQYSKKPTINARQKLPKVQKYNFDKINFNKYEVKTETFSDTIAKKGIFGRIKDAIAGKENIRKDSTVVTLKQGNALDFSKIRSELDSIINSVDKHYTQEIYKIQLKPVVKSDNNDNFYKIFSNLLLSSNELMKIYENAVYESKIDLEREYDQQNSKNNSIRIYLVLGLMTLMFIVSILIMYFTRMAFVYEWKLDAANQKINENLNFKNRILGMLSHELRSPLKIIGIFINRINKRTEDQSIKEYLKSISFTNNTLLMQANQILEYTKNQHVENKLNPVVFNLKNEIHSILSAIEPYIETRNNAFVIQENINPNLMVYSDNTKINQIFMNILGNANKFTENGTITVTTGSEAIDEATVSLTTTIKDTGAGISQSDLQKIFEPYYQGIISDEVENLGAGLGLSLCKEIIELYLGEIAVSSVEHQGTTVTFRINLKLNESRS